MNDYDDEQLAELNVRILELEEERDCLLEEIEELKALWAGAQPTAPTPAP